MLTHKSFMTKAPDIDTVATAPALHRSLARDILAGLRARGAAPGEELSRLALARSLGVSRTPVIGAIALLNAMGAVRIDGRRVRLADPDVDPAPLAAEAPTDASAALMVRIAYDWRGGHLPSEVSERLLQTRYGASRAEVAVTLRRLAEVGAVARNRGHRWRFQAGYGRPEDRAAAYRFRMMIEPAGILEPGFALPEGWIARTRAAHERFLDRTWREFDSVAFFETNAAFHLELAQASGNRYLAQAIDQQNQLRRFYNYGWQRGLDRVRVSVADHLGILGALEAGNRTEAAERMYRHLAGTAALPWRPESVRPGIEL